MAKGLDEAPLVDPHYHGHRGRLRKRFRSGPDAMPDYEILEMALFGAWLRKDTKELAKDLLKKFGTLAEVVNASPERLKEVAGVSERIVTEILYLRALVTRIVKSEVVKREPLSSWSKVLQYCRESMAYQRQNSFGSCFSTRRTNLSRTNSTKQARSIILRYIPMK